MQNIRLYAVFGIPVLHSKSPQMFSPLLSPARDRYLRIRPQSGKDLVRVVKTLIIRGASITSPFKEAMLTLSDHVTDAARAVGAVNCIRYHKETITGHNTDHYGVTGPLEAHGLALRGSRILVLGAGGAARAAVYGLARAGAAVSVSNRTDHKAKRLAAEFGCNVIPWESHSSLPHFDAVVSTILPQGMPPFADALRCDVLLDAIYKPSSMTAYCRERSIPVIGGEKWLAFQGVEAARFYLQKQSTPDVLGQNITGIPNCDSLKILALTPENIHMVRSHDYDLVISAFGQSASFVKECIDEEKHLACGS